MKNLTSILSPAIHRCTDIGGADLCYSVSLEARTVRYGAHPHLNIVRLILDFAIFFQTSPARHSGQLVVKTVPVLSPGHAGRGVDVEVQLVLRPQLQDGGLV